MNYNTVAASQTDQALSGNVAGAKHDHLQRLIVTVATAATGTVVLKDGSVSITITAANTPIGVYPIEIDTPSKTGAWSITTGAGASVLAIGNFS